MAWKTRKLCSNLQTMAQNLKESVQSQMSFHNTFPLPLFSNGLHFLKVQLGRHSINTLIQRAKQLIPLQQSPAGVQRCVDLCILGVNQRQGVTPLHLGRVFSGTRVYLLIEGACIEGAATWCCCPTVVYVWSLTWNLQRKWTTRDLVNNCSEQRASKLNRTQTPQQKHINKTTNKTTMKFEIILPNVFKKNLLL